MANVKTSFNEQESKNIVDAIKRVENVSSAEVVVAVSDASDTYDKGLFKGSFFISIFLGAFLSILYIKFKILNTWSSEVSFYLLLKFLAVSMLFLVISFFISKKLFGKNIKFKLLFSDINDVINKCYSSAFDTFYNKKMYETVDETGFLIYLSFAEKRVVILGDEGINSRIEPKKWEEYSTKIALGMKSKNRSEKIVEVIDEIGEILKSELPVKPDDVNEIPDEIVQL